MQFSQKKETHGKCTNFQFYTKIKKDNRVFEGDGFQVAWHPDSSRIAIAEKVVMAKTPSFNEKKKIKSKLDIVAAEVALSTSDKHGNVKVINLNSFKLH